MKAMIRSQLAAVLALSLSFFFAPQSRADSSPDGARLLVHLLDYLAKDYAGAVADGKIISPSEYEEQREFSEKVAGLGEILEPVKNDATLTTDLAKLRRLVEDKADATSVTQLARSLQERALAATKIPVAPASWPNLARGKELFAQNCASCHGANGKGDGAAGRTLSPPPANFLDDNGMKEVSPLHAYNTIRLGVPGTAMPPFVGLGDKEAWDIAFYILSLRHRDENESAFPLPFSEETLRLVATGSDAELARTLGSSGVSALRRRTQEGQGDDSLAFSAQRLDAAENLYGAGKVEAAKTEALRAYLEGVEPVEPQLRASDPALVVRLEEDMAAVRAGIAGKALSPVLRAAILRAKAGLDSARTTLREAPMSPVVTFLAGAGILVREGFEAVLVIIALLGVIRAAGARKAALYVHAGWVLALLAGGAAWVFSGHLMLMSGASRETMEAVTSLVAVAILLVVGFWLHSQTEIGRWKVCIEGKVQHALDGKNLLGLLGVSFLAVFREAFETVLFLRAIWLESGEAQRSAMAAGVASSLLVIVLLTWALIRYSARIPVRRLFTLSAVVMGGLAVILAGKAVHSFQEIGGVPATAFPLGLRWDVLGLFPSYETMAAQAAALTATLLLWRWGKLPSQPRLQCLTSHLPEGDIESGRIPTQSSPQRDAA